MKLNGTICTLLTVLTAARLLPAPTRGAEAIPNADCMQCHEDKELSKTNAVGKAVSLFVDLKTFAASSHKTNTCVSCHTDVTSKHPDDNIRPKPVYCSACHERQSETYGASVHGLAIAAGEVGAATCADCHGTHNIEPPVSATSRLSRSLQYTTCGECHPDAARDLQGSVHGVALARGIREAPSCTDCHSEHEIQPLKSSAALTISQEVCSRCHASERINTKFNLPKNRVQTFFESYHGLAAHLGDTRAANCASCHGFHKVLPSSDPRSSIHPDNLVATCGKCHPGATSNFALAKIHVDDTSDAGIGNLVNRWVRRFYVVMIVLTVGGMGAHNLMSWLQKALVTLRAKDRVVPRMSRSQRVQHFTLLATFIILAWTGFALKYPDSWVAWLLGSDELIRRWTHRVSGVIMLLGGFYHVWYVIWSAEGRQLVRDFWPKWQDAKDVVLALKYYAGRSAEHPRFARFGYVEKAEYWAVVWGTVIMGVTGLVIWFKIDVTQFLPRWAVDVATTIHYYEAILACLAIVVWHFYHVFFSPDVYPMNWAWFDGKVSEEWHHEHHPLDEQARQAARPAKTGDTPAAAGTADTANT